MNTNSPKDLLEIALQKNELTDYLMGKGIYHFPCKLAETPTDINIIFLRGFNKYIEDNKNTISQFQESLEIALSKLLDEPIGCWWCISILYAYLFGYVEGALLFKINLENLIPKINNRLFEFKDSLYGNRECVGWRFNGGLWENIVNIVPKINKRIKEEGFEININ